MTFENVIQAIIAINPLSVFKLLITISLLFYLVFSLVVVRQVDLMLNVLGGLSQHWIRYITLIHAALVILIFILAILLL